MAPPSAQPRTPRPADSPRRDPDSSGMSLPGTAPRPGARSEGTGPDSRGRRGRREDARAPLHPRRRLRFADPTSGPRTRFGTWALRPQPFRVYGGRGLGPGPRRDRRWPRACPADTGAAASFGLGDDAGEHEAYPGAGTRDPSFTGSTRPYPVVDGLSPGQGNGIRSARPTLAGARGVGPGAGTRDVCGEDAPGTDPPRSAHAHPAPRAAGESAGAPAERRDTRRYRPRRTRDAA